ncbi:MAG: KH domain-containing protein [Methanothrix sp.]
MHIKIPADRIGVLVGPTGSVKSALEEKTKAEMVIDSDTGAVEIIAGDDPIMAMRLAEVVRAIGRGFSPERAIPLLEDEMLMLEVIDLSRVCNTKTDMARIKGRIIGKDGRTREITEKLTGVGISVYGKTVAVIGGPEQIRIARTAIEMLMDGAPHGSVYGFLEKKNQELISSSIGDI